MKLSWYASVLAALASLSEAASTEPVARALPLVQSPFTIPSASLTLSVSGAEYESAPMTFTPAGALVAVPVVLVANIGCDAADYPAELAGNIALISRRICTFAAKATFAKDAGAIGIIIYNNVEGLLQGTLGSEGDYALTVGISLADGQAIVAALVSESVTADLDVDLSEILTYNVLATTKGGDKNNVLAVGGRVGSGCIEWHLLRAASLGD
ncbi:transferrin receptor ectodomain, apical domain-containing protein [Acephala macrosclerotiorum]|nr:transferrin receptor ectodomain, apical domain-containing protein [Acephala macrosclerotiorum]